MGFRIRLVSAALALASATCAMADMIAVESTVADLSQATTPGAFSLYNATVTNVAQSPYGTMADIQFNGYRANFGKNYTSGWSWAGVHVVALTAKNYESRPVKINFIVMVKPNLSDYSGSFNGGFTIPANSTKRFVFNVNPLDPRPYGLETIPPIYPYAYTTILDGARKYTDMTVYHWRFSSQDTLPAKVGIADFKRITLDTSFDSISDAYGQFTGRDWTGKAKSDADLLNDKAAEANDLAAHPGTGETWGAKNLTGVVPPKHWMIVQKNNGRKYIATPEGKLFWSLGLNAVHNEQATQIENRLNMFTSLPSRTGRFASLYQDANTSTGTRETYSFHRQNLMIKYGDSFETPWIDTVKKRLKSWGFNTVGMQSDAALMDGTMPYTIIADTRAFPTRLPTKFVEWQTLPDPFAPSFLSWASTNLGNKIAPHKGKAAFMGVYVDNEMSWGDTTSNAMRWNVALGAINAAPTQPAKLAFLRQLASKYRSIYRLNGAWRTSFSSWSALQNNRSFNPSTISVSMASDFKLFTKNFAHHYYGKVRMALDMNGNTALYLGSRFATVTPEVIAGAAHHVDVFSFNEYGFAKDVDWNYLDSLPKPVLISEFCFSVLDRGSFGGMYEVTSFAERSQALNDYLGQALSRNNIVGAHWYTYTDQPITGRYTDGENKGMGIVDVTDKPYPETVATFRQIAAQMYAYRG